MRKINDITSLLLHIMQPYVQQAKVAVDATCGNGYDSAFMYDKMQDNGKLYCFDVQDIAIENTKKMIDEISIPTKQCEFIKDSHSNIDNYVEGDIDVVFFNLGYLPGADHELTTAGETTITAIEKSLSLLTKGGVISILIYSGHENGKEEKVALLNYFDSLEGKKIKLMRADFPTSPNCPPEIYLLQKVKN